jgi:PAB-dependent poly(A)-specific ribonuclease subunit 2
VPVAVPRHFLESDLSLSTAAPQLPRTFDPLGSDEEVGPGLTLALDAEFCALRHQEARFSAEGRVTTPPSELCLARVSLVRASGPRRDTVLVDDYILPSPTEPILDYLTQYSGVTAEDLSPAASPRHLTTLKNNYLKLQYLVDRGCRFVGHGLIKDFRILNLKVPPERVVDTVELFKLPDQRRVSLRFLAWFVLGELIQEGSHDSIIDARTAMRLAERYSELSAAGGLDALLHRIYSEGHRLNWRPPPSAGAADVPAQDERFI